MFIIHSKAQHEKMLNWLKFHKKILLYQMYSSLLVVAILMCFNLIFIVFIVPLFCGHLFAAGLIYENISNDVRKQNELGYEMAYLSHFWRFDKQRFEYTSPINIPCHMTFIFLFFIFKNNPSLSFIPIIVWYFLSFGVLNFFLFSQLSKILKDFQS